MADPVVTPAANTDATGASIPPIVDEKPSIRSFVPGGAKADTAGIFEGELSKYYCTLSFGAYNRPKPFSSAEFSPDLTICLPLPNELNDNTGVDWDNQNLEAVGDIINGSLASGATAALLRNSGALLTGAGKGIAGGIKSAGGAMGGVSGAAVKALGGGLENMVPDAAQVTSAIQQSQGLAPNPNPSVMFRGPQLREFTYTWTIFPDNKKQSDALRTMIKRIKSRVLPKSAGSDSASVLNYPNTVQINFFPWDTVGSDNPWGWGSNTIIRIKKCVVKSFNVNYTPTNVPAFFADGGDSPHAVATNITITLQEIEYMLANDWGGGYGEATTLETIGSGVAAVGGAIVSGSADLIKRGASAALDLTEGEPPANADQEQAAAAAQPGGGS
jgi:hypothetical protein